MCLEDENIWKNKMVDIRPKTKTWLYEALVLSTLRYGM